jgi:tetratricopeptide (TPR) repeat protein
VKFDAHRWCATFVFFVAFLVYAMTAAPSVSYWDCGEFAACSYTMSVPHPPGSPLFVLLGRIFSLIPFAKDIAVRVTYVSVFGASFAILFAYLIIVQLVRHIRGREKTLTDKIITYGSAMIGSLSLAWTYSMWFNSVESEVYAMSQFFTHIVVWLILVWHEKADDPGSERYLLLIAYMFGCSTALHLLNVLCVPAIALIIYFRLRKFEMKSFIGVVAASGLVFIMIYPGVVKWLPGLASKVTLSAPFIIVALLFLIFWWAAKQRHGIIGVTVASLLLVIVGYSSYMALYVRSGLQPGIDENDPENPAAFLSYLNREQYGDWSFLPRVWNNDPAYKSESDYFWRYQVDKMFNRYLFWQFIGRQGAPHNEYQDAGVSPKYSVISLVKDEPTGALRFLAIITCVPFLLGLWGFVYQYMKHKKDWFIILTLFFMTGYAVILYLNQPDPQPRERDYSYVGAFFAFALWMGIGASSIIEWASKLIKNPPRINFAAAGTVVLLALLSPVMLLAQNYEMNDRSGNHVAFDYSYNMLMSCGKNGILFTNGDNDTFPVWYLQEVEHIRRDVRLVNLSLINTGWYIKQMKERDPKVPISFTDAYIDRYLDQHDAQALMSRYWPPDKQKIELNTSEGKMVWNMPATMYIPVSREEKSRANNFLRVQDIIILDILRTNYDPSKTPVPKPVYFAVTVANSNMIGLRDYLTMEGLVFRVNPRGRQTMDPDKIREDLFVTFKDHFRGIADPRVHYDDNVEKLMQNYRSAFLQLSYYYATQPDVNPESGSEFATLDQQIANFDKLSNHRKALAALERMEEMIPEAVRPISSPELSIQIGRMYHDLGRPDELKNRLEAASKRDDLSLESASRVAALWIAGFNDTTRADALINKALGSNPTAENYLSVARELYSGGSYAWAVRYFDRVLAVDPNNGTAVGGLIQTCETLGDHTKALSVLETWVAHHPTDQGAKQRLDNLRAQMAGTTAPSAPKTKN